MKILKIVFSALLITSITPSILAQCNLTVTPTTDTVECGEPLTISALGLSPTSVLTTNFNGGVLGPGWSTLVNGQYNNPCGPTLDGTPALWFGNVPAPRTLTTNPLDVSCGGEICFDLNMATQGGSSPCEGPDLLNEGVYLQYSIDGGVTWVDIYYFQPGQGGIVGPYLVWANYCFLIPPAAMTTATIFQWDQPAVSGAGFDHWGIDNITITPSDCNFWYDWSHIPGFPDDPNQTISPSNTTTYYVSYTDGTTICTDSVIVNVIPWEIEIIGNPNSIDCGSCSDLAVEFLTGVNGSIVDNFDSGIDPIMWADIQGGTASTICGGGATGNALYFNGPNIDRYAETVAVDATSCGNIDFCLFMGNVASGGFPCENNETGDDLVLEYSIDNGATFVLIATYLQSLWDGANYQQCFSETMPLAAQTSSTIFRWRQLNFFAALGSDNWSLDEVEVSCVSSTTTYNWTTGVVNDATSPTPIACPLADELYTVSVVNSATGCSDTDTSTLFVNTCSCFFTQFDGAVVVQSVGVVDVNGTFEYLFSPTTGTIEVEATNATGTYSQTFNAPFTDNVLDNYSITGIPNDGSIITLDIYFSDSLSCNQTFDLVPPSSCAFLQFDGTIDPQPGGDLDVNGTFQFLFSPTAGTIEVEATNGTGTYSQTFNPPFINEQTYDYSITGISNDGSIITVVVSFSDSLSCTDTLQLSSNVSIEVIDGLENSCIVSPNPVSEEAQLVFNNENQEEVSITIVNVRGELVFETTTEEQSISIKGNQFKQGIYFFTVKSSDASKDCSGKFAVTY